jgi:hypothetical protein
MFASRGRSASADNNDVPLNVAPIPSGILACRNGTDGGLEWGPDEYSGGTVRPPSVLWRHPRWGSRCRYGTDFCFCVPY